MEQVLRASENRISKYFNGTSIQGPRFNMQTGLMRNRILNIKEDDKTFTQLRLNVNSTGIINRVLQDTEIARDFPKTESTPKNVIRILKEHGIKGVKTFCIHSSRKGTFIARGNKWDWEIKKLTARSKENIPAEMLSRVKLLLDKGIKVEKLYIGKAVDMPILDIAKAEIKLQAKHLSEEISYAAVAVLAGTEEAVNAIREAHRKNKNAMSMIPRYVHLPDPVLLARVKGYNELIEIGRWL